MRNSPINLAILFCWISLISFSQELRLGLPLGHKYPIGSFNYSTDSKFIISSSSDGVKLWESSTGYLLNSFDERSGINIAKLSPDEAKAYAVITNSRRKKSKEQLYSDKLINSFKLNDKVKSVVLNNNTELFAVNFYNNDSQVFINTKRKVESISFQKTKTLATLKNSLNEDIIIQLKDKFIIGYNMHTKKTIYSISGFYNGECGFALSPNQKCFLVNACTSFSQYSANIGASNGFNVYDATTGKSIHSFYPSVDKLRHTSVSENQKYLSIVSHTGKSQVLDLSTGKLAHVLNTEFAVSSEFSSDSRYLLTKSDMRLIEDLGMGKELIMKESQWIWNISNGSLISILENSKRGNKKFENFELSVSYKDSKIAVIRKIEDGLANPYKELIGHSDQVIFTSLSPDGKMAVTASKDETVKIWDAFTGELLYTLKGYSSNATFVQFKKDNQILLTLSEDKTQKIWDLPSKKLLHHIQVQNTIKKNGIENEISSDDNFIIIKDVKTGKQLIKQFFFNNKEVLWLLPKGYYFATKKAASKLYYIKGLQTIGFEQLDARYNRPDKVLKVLGSISGTKNTTMIKAYQKAWQKRIKKLAIDTTSFKVGFSIPESDFYNRENISYEQNNSELELHIKALDSIYLLDRFNIWINEVPVFGSKGISLKNKKKNAIDTLLKVKLSNGINKIETSVLNVNGIESYRLPLYVNYTPKKPIVEKLYFVGIGIDLYKEEGHNLNYSVKDIRDLSVQLKQKYGSQIEIDTLFNQNVTIKNILELKKKLKKSKVDDKVIISFSGHGLLSKDLDYYLGTYDVNFNSPEQNGLPYEDLEYLLDGIPSRKKLLLIDACHSGEVDKDEVEAIAMLEKQKEGLKGTITIKSKNAKMGMKNSFELMKELFHNIDRATGATIISAAAGTQFAQERGDLKNGVFTYCILNQLIEKETITVSELKQLISEQVKEITNGLQQPTSRNETIENDWKVW